MLRLGMQDSKANAEKKKSASYRNQKDAFAETRRLIIFMYCKEETRDEDKYQLVCLFAERN